MRSTNLRSKDNSRVRVVDQVFTQFKGDGAIVGGDAEGNGTVRDTFGCCEFPGEILRVEFGLERFQFTVFDGEKNCVVATVNHHNLHLVSSKVVLSAGENLEFIFAAATRP